MKIIRKQFFVEKSFIILYYYNDKKSIYKKEKSYIKIYVFIFIDFEK